MATGGLLTAACAGSPVAPGTDQHMVMLPVPTPGPVSESIVVRGRVTQSAPTTHFEVAGATVTIADGVNSGKSATTDATGFYVIDDVQPGSFMVNVAANDFVGVSRRVDAPRDAVENFNLAPVARTLSYTFNGSVRDTDGTCSDGAAQRPCRIVMIPIHNAGAVTARLEWTAGSAVDLDLALFQTHVPAPLERSAQPGVASERVSAHVPGASNYELRITYASGTGQANYTITIECPN
jgi:hypothetical protein